MARTDGLCSLWQNLPDSDNIGFLLHRTQCGLDIWHSTFRSIKAGWQSIDHISFYQSDNEFPMDISHICQLLNSSKEGLDNPSKLH